MPGPGDIWMAVVPESRSSGQEQIDLHPWGFCCFAPWACLDRVINEVECEGRVEGKGRVRVRLEKAFSTRRELVKFLTAAGLSYY